MEGGRSSTVIDGWAVELEQTGKVVAQVAMMAGVTALVVSSLLAVEVLASPFANQSGSIEPVGMQYSLDTMNRELAMDGRGLPVLCDDLGVPAR